MKILAILLTTSIFSYSLYAVPTNIGYSGAPGRGTCASTCHGVAGGTVAVNGFPTEYIPDSTYVITIQRMSGLAIKNFNGSIRRVAGNQNAGVITGGQGTSTYNVAGETNGIHLSTFDQVSATFNWTAPAAGSGAVRLYVGAHQGSQPGPNTTIQQTATEAVIELPPEAASNPNPPNGATHVELGGVVLSWMPGAGAETHDIFFGQEEPLPMIAGNHSDSSLPLSNSLTPGTTYLWRVDSRNDVGTTTGPLWNFMTGEVPDTVIHSYPEHESTEVPIPLQLVWHTALRTDYYNVCFGDVNPPPMVEENVLDTMFDVTSLVDPGVTYYWGIAAVNEFGTSPSPIWEFTTEANAVGELANIVPTAIAFGPAYPNPFNAEVTIPFALPKRTHVQLEIFDITGRMIGRVADSIFEAGIHRVQWRSSTFATGVYFVKLTADEIVRVEKVIVLK